MFSQQTVRDQIAYFSNPARLRVPAFRVVDGLQLSQAKPGEQVLATAVALIAMCESVGAPLSEVITKASRTMADVDGPFTSHLQAVRDYANGELLKGGY